jgi:phospholipid transport system substrate-binding protein
MERTKRPWTVSVTGGLLALVLSLALGASGACGGQPTEDVKNLLDEVMAILHNPNLNSPARKRQRLELIEQVAMRRFDYREMAKRCLNATWLELSRAQQDEFAHLFTQLLKASYAGRIDEIASARVDYRSERQDGNTAVVRAVFLRPNDKVPVDFCLLREPQGWMIYDLIIEDVSLMKNFQDQFGRIIQGGSYKDLLRRLRNKLKEETGE